MNGGARPCALNRPTASGLRRATRSASWLVARPRTSPKICLRLVADPLPVIAWTSAITRSRSPTVRHASRAGGGSIP
jgi:hypothetical protein